MFKIEISLKIVNVIRDIMKMKALFALKQRFATQVFFLMKLKDSVLNAIIIAVNALCII